MESSSLRNTQRSFDFEVKPKEETKLNSEAMVQSFAEASVQYSQVIEDEPLVSQLNVFAIFMSSVARLKLKTQVIRLTSKGKQHPRSLKVEFSEAAILALDSSKTVEDLTGFKAAFGSCSLGWTTRSFFKKGASCSTTLEAISSISQNKESAAFNKSRTSDLPGLSVYYAAQGQQKCLDLLFPDIALFKIWTVGLEMLVLASQGVMLEEERLEQLQIHRASVCSP